MSSKPTFTFTHEEWLDEGHRRFGPDSSKWRFVCPVCNTVQSKADFLEHTELEEQQISAVVAFSCIGRWAKGGPARGGLDEAPENPRPGALGCNYAGGGLFALNPIEVRFGDGQPLSVFAFADDD